MSSILEKISPWPWHVYLGVPSTGVESCQHEYVAECDDGNINLDKAELNARMIAAAPELLDAIKVAKECLESDNPMMGKQHVIDKALSILDNAIAKVEGGIE